MKKDIWLTAEGERRAVSLTDKVPVKLVSRDGTASFNDYSVLKEHTLVIKVNGGIVFRILCTDLYLRELVYGRLYTEGITDEDTGRLQLMFEKKSDEESDALITGGLLKTENSGGDGYPFNDVIKKRISDRIPNRPVDLKDVFSLADEFGRGTVLNTVTKGTHSAFLMYDHNIVFSCEDIGRHNCVDKAVGYALLNDIPLDECILYSSGRVPSDMAEKVIAAGIPILVSKAVPTDRAIKLAQKYRLTLICRAWSDSCTVFYNTGTDE
ncbi:MAG: formate dehydrogenase accessory sulfurtransferase FdhD [Lachnospiraceae bacterium]|nr:formate dehydrogenase accessory sulfurtransferase FdhD [Lachnospiraceae bacterium]